MTLHTDAIAYRSSPESAPAGKDQTAMTWNPDEVQGHEPSGLARTARKVSAGTRWVVLIVVTGLGMAAIVGIVCAAAYALIQSNL